MSRLPLIIHERRGQWARQLRPRVVAWSVRVIETRSARDLEAALGLSACPLLVVDLGARPGAALDELGRGLPAAPGTLSLVLDPGSHPGVALLARELGVTHIVAGPVTPPAVVALLARWLPLARRRAEANGWAGEPAHEAETWEFPGRHPATAQT